MKNALYLAEQIIFLITWCHLYKRLFPHYKFQRRILGVVYSILVLVFVGMLGETMSRQLGPLIGIGLSGGVVLAVSRGKQPAAVVEALISYILAKTMWLLSVMVGFCLSRGFGKTDILAESIFICVTQISITLILNRHINRKRWIVIAEKYSMQLVMTLSALFVVSYIIVLVPYSREKLEIYMYALFVTLISVILLLIWTANDLNHRKELEEKSQHINDLVRSTHRYKEFIPAVSREFRRIAEETGDEISEELSDIMKEIEALQRSVRKLDQEELKKIPSLDETGLTLLDSQLRAQWAEAQEAGVTLECLVMTPARELVERDGVERAHLMQLEGDLFRNGLRAIERKGEEGGRILLVLGRSGRGYGLKLCDTGAPFPREVLEHLGRRGITTGGTGHGMADMLEILALHRASLEIREGREGSVFTKMVELCFDGRGVVKVDYPSLGIFYEQELKELTKV